MRAFTKTLFAFSLIAIGACGPTPPTGVGGAGGGGNPGPNTRPGCFGPNKTVVVGDSYISWISHTLPSDLQRESGQIWNHYAVGGSSIASGGITGLIPQQLETAIAQLGTFNTVVFDGGGNDVLICDELKYPGCNTCKNSPTAPTLPVCQRIVDDALAAATRMTERAKQVGVKDMVYFFYPDVPTGTLIGGASPNEINTYGLNKAKALCDSAYAILQVRCHFVDMRPTFQGHPEYFALGDIHPSPLGSAAMAKTIWGKMKTDCVSQPSSAGCCDP
ncbi:MAG TPA: SGNH/GDSL hydrolase family protein [Polyangiaceae bacterium]|nr:SGNH/GDSL hydrolase family protein [Polyangiaceae bacterium]